MLLAGIVIAVAAYLLGSIPTGYLLVRIFRRQDIRSVGSGNIGATNVLRFGGKGLGILTFILDVLKGSAAVWLGGALGAWLMPAAPPSIDPLRTAQALAALFAVLGHMFTCWLHFHGGKGVATGFGVFLVASPWAALAAIGVFALVLALSRYVSVGSIAASVAFMIFAWYFPPGPHPPVFYAVECVIALLIIVKHHTNIRRLFDGTEARLGAKGFA
ncbi:MAG: glycerol-3-phosphate 1-O-acyltransferase PlsY [Terracidiphilus sp.]